MKKLIALLLAMVMVVGLCACGDKEEKKTPADDAQNIVNDALENVDVDVDLDGMAELEDALADLDNIDIDDLVADEDITGRYNLTFVFDYDGTVVYDATTEDETLWIQLNADGTGSMRNMDGDIIELGWEDGVLWYADDPTISSTFSVVDGTMTMDDGDYINSLEKQ